MEVYIFLYDTVETLIYMRDVLGIATDVATSRKGEEWAANRDLSLSPESIAKVGFYHILIDTA